MADSKLSTDTGAQNLMDIIGCQISGTLHVDKKRLKFLKDRSTRLLFLSNRVPRKNVCGLYCFESIYATTAEFAYSTLELQSAKTYEPSDKKGFGLLIMFEKADKSPLKFICPGRKESEEWVKKINEAINADKNFSQDSAYGSGGSFIGERLKHIQQQVPNYDEINEETMYQTNKCKDAEYSHRIERTISDKRVSSRGAKQMANAELQDQINDYENPEEQFYLNGNLGKRNNDVEYTHRKERTISDKRVSSRGAKQMANAELQGQASDYENPEEQFYINENLGKRNHDEEHTRRKERINSRDAKPAATSGPQDETYLYEAYEDRSNDNVGNRNHGVPETGTNVKSQSFITSDTTTQGDERFKILAQEAQAKFKSRGTGPQKKQYASPSINKQNTTSNYSQPTKLYSANDQDASFIPIREGSPCRSMSYLSVASGVSDAVPMTTPVRSSRGEEEALYVNAHENGSIYEKKTGHRK